MYAMSSFLRIVFITKIKQKDFSLFFCAIQMTKKFYRWVKDILFRIAKSFIVIQYTPDFFTLFFYSSDAQIFIYPYNPRYIILRVVRSEKSKENIAVFSFLFVWFYFRFCYLASLYIFFSYFDCFQIVEVFLIFSYSFSFQLFSNR